ncbi:putative transposase [Lunatimonas lonarensis]|uniref:Putative transposase n=1 Tax=Lunatimonas lonarensis TaxID=1232681 RepID=R7ZRY8_9BACT|nr:putative transposase [Lunatimonas lonarensis]
MSDSLFVGKGIITNKGQKLIAINGMLDYIHILIGMKPSRCLCDR